MHVKLTTADETAWCGITLGTEQFYKDSEHAALQGMYEAKQTVCAECIDLIIHCLAQMRKNTNDK